MTVVYDNKGNEYKVTHQVDVKEWLESGFTLEKPKTKKDKTEDTE